ncbi:MAG: sialate O-acetylesterase [Eubacteriales bacterium]
MKLTKKMSALCVFLVLVLLASLLSSCADLDDVTNIAETDTDSRTEKESESYAVKDNKKVLDLYLIAGQSNATGCTSITNLTAAYNFYPDLISGVSNVLYAGNSRANSGKRDRVIDWQETTMWLGMSENHFGPEAGMAKALAAYYNKDSGSYAGIIKYAYGGSSLLNNTEGETHKDGNWVSPSYQKTLSPSSVVDGVTGQMYRNFLDQVETNVREVLNKEGNMADYNFDSVRICGLYWMQGCQDKGSVSEYEIAFKYFSQDIRNDLSALMKEITGSDDDCGASKMPITVGTISQTQNMTSLSVETTNKNFIALQKSFAVKIANCYVVDNSAYAICKWENGKMVVLGSDQWHWNQADMLEIGYNVGDMMLKVAKG